MTSRISHLVRFLIFYLFFQFSLHYLVFKLLFLTFFFYKFNSHSHFITSHSKFIYFISVMLSNSSLIGCSFPEYTVATNTFILNQPNVFNTQSTVHYSDVNSKVCKLLIPYPFFSKYFSLYIYSISK